MPLPAHLARPIEVSMIDSFAWNLTEDGNVIMGVRHRKYTLEAV
jgi:hypothetical protein